MVLESEMVIVVVEDDNSIADLLHLYLTRANYRVYLCRDVDSAISTIADRQPSLVILDIGLPGDRDGLDLCRHLRAGGNEVAIILLTAREDEIDRVLGLELGADDYVTKPFSPRELVARVKNILRRTTAVRPEDPAKLEHFELGNSVVDLKRREVIIDGLPEPFTTREFDLLVFLLENRGRALSRRQLLDGVWGDGWYGDERTVDVHVRQLRKKLGASLPLETVWGLGYRLD